MDKTNNKTTRERVFGELKQMLAETIGEDVVEMIGVTEGSTFIDDLQMDSIKIVAFAEKVNARYGEEVDLVTWLSKKPVWKVLRLSFGDVVEFISNGID
jgi:acyl carrier protein